MKLILPLAGGGPFANDVIVETDHIASAHVRRIPTTNEKGVIELVFTNGITVKVFCDDSAQQFLERITTSEPAKPQH